MNASEIETDADIIDISINIYTFNEPDMLIIKIYMESRTFEHDIQSVVHAPETNRCRCNGYKCWCNR